MEFNDYLKIKRAEGRKVSYELTYVDMVRDLKAGLLLSQIMYWFTPDENGKSKTRVTYKGRRAIAKARSDWFEEIRMTEKEYDSAIKVLKHYKIVDVVNSMFNSKRTPFIMINEDIFMALYVEAVGIDSVLLKTEHRYKQISKTEIAKKVIPLTESTTEITTKNNIGNFDKQNPTIPFKDYYFNNEIDENIAYYIERYLYIHRQEKYTVDKWNEIVENLDEIQYVDCKDIDYIIDKYLATDFKQHSLYHSSLDSILKNRMYEVGII